MAVSSSPGAGARAQQVSADEDPRHTGIQTAGGKGAGLEMLSAAGIAVPPWTVLDTGVFASFIDAHGFGSLIDDLTAAVDLDDAVKRAALLREKIATASLPDDVVSRIDAACSELGDVPLAVRSSGGAEDGSQHSHAGQFDTFLNVRGRDAIDNAVRRCWASAFSERSIRYLYSHDGAPSASVAVVLQQFVSARAAGVLFTVDPLSGSPDSLLLSAVYGLGEGLVSGVVDADSVTIDRGSGAVIDRVIGVKDEQIVATEGGVITAEVAPDLRAATAVSDEEISRLVELGLQIEKIAGAPQDIEWLIDGDTIWVVQTRPITSTGPAAVPGAKILGAGEELAADDLRIWDNSNIIESFSGISSPLTFTTAADVYGRVYLSYARSLNVSADQLEQIRDWNSVMLGYFHGRVYYNLLHWYRMVGIAPGYPLNRRVLEVALGVDEPLDDELAKTLKPFTFGSLPRRIVSRTVTTATYIKRFMQIDRLCDDFMDSFYRVYDEYDGVDYNSLGGDEVYARYRAMERDLVDRWGPMMVLDAILLTSSGLLYALTKAFVKDPPEWFLYAVVSPGADVESAEPARAMSAMAEYVRGDSELLEFVNTTPVDQAYPQLQASKWTQFQDMVDDYVARFGYRSLDELKLETPD
ncbi:MAG: pyruvate, water dikinase, partial [Rhodococcus sp.]|nr:pyruvate, water dikinase [Rhodococcus sp. (in: high G+C Gram-positive bacteria)]